MVFFSLASVCRPLFSLLIDPLFPSDQFFSELKRGGVSKKSGKGFLFFFLGAFVELHPSRPFLVPKKNQMVVPRYVLTAGISKRSNNSIPILRNFVFFFPLSSAPNL